MSLDGVLANPSLLSYLNTLHGKTVLVETKSGQQYVGIFGASSPEMEIGLTYAYMKTPENQKNILGKKDEIMDKMVFKFADCVCISVVWNEEKTITGFATDRDYHSKSNGVDEELEEWNGEDEGEEIENYMPDVRQSYQKGNGWSADEMFKVNSSVHGVESTFVEDMSQYTTVDFQATEEERAKADQIARDIENSTRSKFYSRLENDDDERDLDKQTTEDDLDPGNRKKGNRNSFGMNNNANTGRRGDKMGQGNKRAEFLRNDRRGSGQQQPPQQQSQRYAQGQYSTRGPPYVAGKRNSTGGDDQFGGEWQNPPKEIPRGKDVKVFENSNFKSRAQKTGPTGRVEELKQWNTDFTNSYKQNKDGREQSPTDSSTRPPQQTTSGNAWNNGPPSSLLSSQQQTTSASPQQEHPEPEAKETPEQISQLNLSDDKASEKADSEKTDSGKKFTFNPDAPAFTPRAQPPTTPTGPMQQIPMGIVPMQPGSLPPGMIVQTGQPIIGHWQPSYVQMQPTPYQVAYLPTQPMVSQAQIQGQRGNGGAPQIGNFSNQQRRNGPGQQPMMVPNGQWAPGAVVMNPPMGYYQYPAAGGQPGQQFPNNPMVQQGQQGVPNQMFHQQRYPMGYMVPQGAQPPRYPPGQQPPEGQFQPQSSATSTTGASSQPPTPGPQPPPVASPGQQHPSGRGSPAPPPPAQQFVSQASHINVGPPHAQQAYFQPPQTSMYMYNPNQMVVYPGQVPMGQIPMGQDGQPQPHMEGGQQQQQFVDPNQQYGGQFIPGPQFYQQQQQPMSRQNSVPQNFNNGQPSTGAAPPPMASQPTNTSAPPPPPVPQPVNSPLTQN